LRDGHLNEAAQLARQSMQIPGIPGTELRGHGYLLAAALAEAGDLAAAEQACAATLAQARDAGDLVFLGDLLRIMADLDLRAGRTGDAAAHLREAAQLSLQTGAWLMTLNVLEDCGHLCAATGRPADAVTVWAAFDTFNQQGGIEYLDTDPWVHRWEEARRNAREVLGPDRARAAEQRGAAMSLATAAEYALLLTAPSSPPPAPAAPGTAGLSARERELVTLVARGRTDADIAAQLYISIRTVRSHLDRIRDKTGCRRRADLTRLALTAGLV
jgi:DNA-binding CsgD family transcriptional regulator